MRFVIKLSNVGIWNLNPPAQFISLTALQIFFTQVKRTLYFFSNTSVFPQSKFSAFFGLEYLFSFSTSPSHLYLWTYNFFMKPVSIPSLISSSQNIFSLYNTAFFLHRTPLTITVVMFKDRFRFYGASCLHNWGIFPRKKNIKLQIQI